MTGQQPTTEKLAAQIREAFDGLAVPAENELLHPDCMDDVDIQEFYGGVRWQEMTDAMVVNGYAAPTAFSAKAFQYYLPAFLLWTLRNPDSTDYAGEAILLALDPGTPKEMLHDFRMSKFALLTERQPEAVRAFLTHVAAHPDLGEFAQAALENYWFEA